MKNTLEHIIRKSLIEQISGVSDLITPIDSTDIPTAGELETSRSTRDIQMKIKIFSTYGSSVDNQAAKAAGAIWAFRIRVLTEKNLEHRQVIRGINQHILKSNPDIAKFANNNYTFICSVDQKDSKRNYYYNMWIFAGDPVMQNLQPALQPASDINFGDIRVVGNFNIGTAKGIIANNDFFSQQQKIINDASIIDTKKQKEIRKYIDWLNSLKRINKFKITDIETELTPPAEYVSTTKNVEKQLIDIIQSNGGPTPAGLLAYQFTGLYDTIQRRPIEGIFYNPDTNVQVFNGNVAVKPNKMQIYLNTGIATNLKWSDVTDEYFTGQLKDGLSVDGGIITNNDGIKTAITIDNKEIPRISTVTDSSNIELIKWLQEDILLLLQIDSVFNTIVGKFFAVQSPIGESVSRFKQKNSADGVWDTDFYHVVGAVNLFLIIINTPKEQQASKSKAFFTIDSTTGLKTLKSDTTTNISEPVRKYMINLIKST